jgi:hypothetical protein
MGLARMFVAGLRTVAAAARSSPGWQRDLAMIDYLEPDLPMADSQGVLPEGTLQYSEGIIELRIQGKSVAKTRKQWADYICGMDEASRGKLRMRGFPYRSYDSKMTRGKNMQRALLQLEGLNKAHPGATLDELIEEINRKGCWGL